MPKTTFFDIAFRVLFIIPVKINSSTRGIHNRHMYTKHLTVEINPSILFLATNMLAED